MKRENVVRIPTGALVMACVLSAALVAAGCGGNGDKDTHASAELLLQPAAAQGPDPFTDSTATPTATPPPATRTPRPASSGQTAPRSVSGGTPGLYGGTSRAGSCDVLGQIDHLTADRGRAHAFARAAGVSPDAVPGYLRGLTSVVLRADTRVTNHGYRDGGATSFPSVLEAGTAVLVDNHGVPRVRCACGNPLAPPVGPGGHAGTSGRAWSGYRPGQVIVVAPTTRVITGITIVDVDDHTWIERPIGHQGHRHDHAVPPPRTAAPPPVPTPDDSASPDRHGASPSDGGGSPSHEASPSPSPTPSPSDCTTPTATVAPDTTDSTPAGARAGTPTAAPSGTPASTPAPPGRPTDCPTATATATATATPSPPTTTPAGPLVPPENPRVPPGDPSLPDGGATTPHAPDTGSVFGSPTDVFDS